MPKKKNTRKPRVEQPTYSSTTKPWVKWSAIIVIVALLMAVMLAAISAAPAKAATPSASPTVCAPIDTDGDGITNNNDSDIDGDGIVNGKDADIDGDKIGNATDKDPAATNCDNSTTPPKLNENLNTDGTAKATGLAWQWVVGILAIGFGYLTLRRARGRK